MSAPHIDTPLSPLHSLVLPSLGDGQLVQLIVDCSRRDFVDAVTPYFGQDVIGGESPEARWLFLICNPSGKQAAPLQTESEVITAFLHFVEFYAFAGSGRMQIFLLVDLELEGVLWELGMKRLLEVGAVGGVA